jgi:hypothetical protein
MRLAVGFRSAYFQTSLSFFLVSRFPPLTSQRSAPQQQQQQQQQHQVYVQHPSHLYRDMSSDPGRMGAHAGFEGGLGYASFSGPVQFIPLPAHPADNASAAPVHASKSAHPYAHSGAQPYHEMMYHVAPRAGAPYKDLSGAPCNPSQPLLAGMQPAPALPGYPMPFGSMLPAQAHPGSYPVGVSLMQVHSGTGPVQMQAPTLVHMPLHHGTPASMSSSYAPGYPPPQQYTMMYTMPPQGMATPFTMPMPMHMAPGPMYASRAATPQPYCATPAPTPSPATDATGPLERVRHADDSDLHLSRKAMRRSANTYQKQCACCHTTE